MAIQLQLNTNLFLEHDYIQVFVLLVPLISTEDLHFRA